MVEPPVRRTGQRLRIAVLDELKSRLLSGQYPAGSRISVEEVKAEPGVSMRLVMDAMRRLEAIGIVQIIPQSGCRVANYTSQEILDFFGRFEGDVAAAAATRRTDARFGLDPTWQPIADFEHPADTATRSRGDRFLNREFQLVVHHMALPRVMVERMRDMSDFFINIIGGARHLSDAVMRRNHDVIRSRNGEVSRVALQSHIVETVADLRGDLDKAA